MNTNNSKDLILPCRINQLSTHSLLHCFLPALTSLLSLCPSFLLFMESPAQLTSIHKAGVCPSLLSSIFLCGVRANSLCVGIFKCSAQALSSLISNTKSSQEYMRIPAPLGLSLFDSYFSLRSSTSLDSVAAFAGNLLKTATEPKTCPDAPAEPQQC